MSILVKDVVNELRSSILMDLDAVNFHYPNVIVLKALNTTIMDVLAKKPIILFSSPGAYGKSSAFKIAVGATIDDTAIINIPEEYQEALMHGTAVRLLPANAKDSQTTTLIQISMARFNELMTQ